MRWPSCSFCGGFPRLKVRWNSFFSNQTYGGGELLVKKRDFLGFLPSLFFGPKLAISCLMHRRSPLRRFQFLFSPVSKLTFPFLRGLQILP